ncbi:MAG: DUF3098 domain-containing protein [Prevotella sp.]|nr:DUF3098 domain-containing protein [Prevotella sp.]
MSTTPNNSSPLTKGSYKAGKKITRHRILLAACVLIIAGYVLMSGSGSTEQSFNPDVFSTRRIVIAPVLCLPGYILIGIGIIVKK